MTDYENKSKNTYVKNDRDARACIKAVLSFLQLFMPETTARKLESVILLAAGMSVKRIVELTGLSDRSIRSTGRAVKDGRISGEREVEENGIRCPKFG